MACARVVEAHAELAVGAAFVDVVIPLARFGERDLEPDVRLHELRDLTQRLAEGRARVLRAVLGLIALRVRGAQLANGVEGVPAGLGEDAVGGRGVLRFERRVHGLAAAQAEGVEAGHRQRRRRALQRPRQLRRHGHCAKR